MLEQPWKLKKWHKQRIRMALINFMANFHISRTMCYLNICNKANYIVNGKVFLTFRPARKTFSIAVQADLKTLRFQSQIRRSGYFRDNQQGFACYRPLHSFREPAGPADRLPFPSAPSTLKAGTQLARPFSTFARSPT